VRCLQTVPRRATAPARKLESAAVERKSAPTDLSIPESSPQPHQASNRPQRLRIQIVPELSSHLCSSPRSAR
jgi:hypothetical protein